MLKTLGGDRLHAGKREQVELSEYGRSTHDLSYLFRTTASMGTIIPFACEVVLPGDEFDIDLDVRVLTNPTVGPVFGSAKVGLDIFTGDVRLYQGKLHNNLTGIGIKTDTLKLPIMKLKSEWLPDTSLDSTIDLDNMSINPSCILNYLGTRGVGVVVSAVEPDPLPKKEIQVVPWLMYWDTVKNYYSNKQEKKGYVIHTGPQDLVQNVDTISVGPNTLPVWPATDLLPLTEGTYITVESSAAQPLNQILVDTNFGVISMNELGTVTANTGAGDYTILYDFARYGNRTALDWRYIDTRTLPTGEIRVESFDLSEIDNMRESILAKAQSADAWLLNDSAGAPDEALYPWRYILESQGQADILQSMKFSQEGLAVKTYLSDLFNNWLDTDWIDGAGGINELTRVDTSEGYFEIDTLNFAEKLYELLNKIVAAGNTYDDYLDAAYTSKRWSRPEIPVYHGGLIKELVFQEVISNSESSGDGGTQPLGTLGGRGVLSGKHKGGSVSFKANDIGYMMGMVHVTPRIDYGQGNRWDTGLKTIADFHVAGLDEIGFQELITNQMAWWTSNYDGTKWVEQSAGKQPAWQNYRTNVNRIFGNFAIEGNQSYMVFARKYKGIVEDDLVRIDDLTTYIDPAIYNNIFAQTSLDSQNLWIQIAVNIRARRIMSTRVMPNL